jgi:hypothetical protein
MPRPSIKATYDKAINDIAILERFLQKNNSLPPNMQGFVAEIIMLRLFSILESCIKDTATRVACGSNYRNGRTSTPTTICRSLNDALNKFKTTNRNRPIQNLKFTTVHDANDSVKYIIPSTEPFRNNLNNFGVQIDEMRKVRNHVAHHYKSTYSDYKKIIIRRYGAFLNIKPSVFLLSTKRQQRPIMNEYIITTKIIINDITKG